MALSTTDKLIAAYLAFVTGVIAWRGATGHGVVWWLLLAHALFGVLLFLLSRLRDTDRVGVFLHDTYPLFLLTGFYTELGILSHALSAERIAAGDAVVQGWELALFGMQVSYEWIRRAPSVFWSGLLHLSYTSYYPVVLLGPILPMVAGRRDAGRRALLATMIAFVACYVVFLLFPVAGPNYTFEHPSGPVREVWSARLVYGILGAGSAEGTAFPSSHVAATLAVVASLWTSWRRLAAVFLAPALLLTVATVYCQMHYGVDALAGAAIGIAAAAAARRLPL